MSTAELWTLGRKVTVGSGPKLSAAAALARAAPSGEAPAAGPRRRSACQRTGKLASSYTGAIISYSSAWHSQTVARRKSQILLLVVTHAQSES